MAQLYSYKQKFWEDIYKWKLDTIGKILSVPTITLDSEISSFQSLIVSIENPYLHSLFIL